MAPTASHHDRLRRPISMKGANDGLNATTAAGQPQIRPPATPATIHRLLLPAQRLSAVFGQMSVASISGQAQRAGRQRTRAYARTAIGIAHHRIAGRRRQIAKTGPTIGG
jgi:hypothetical protein